MSGPSGLDELDSGGGFTRIAPILFGGLGWLTTTMFHVQLHVAIQSETQQVWSEIEDAIDTFISENPDEAAKVPDTVYVGSASGKKPMIWNRDIFDTIVASADHRRMFAWLVAGKPWKQLFVYTSGSVLYSEMSAVHKQLHDARIKLLDYWWYWTGSEFEQGVDIIPPTRYTVNDTFRLAAKVLIFKFFFPLIRGAAGLIVLLYQKLFGTKWKRDIKELVNELSAEDEERMTKEIILEIETTANEIETIVSTPSGRIF